MSTVDQTSQSGELRAASDAAASPVRLRSIIVLAGAVRRTPLARSIGRSILDLPFPGGGTIATRHLDAAERLASTMGLTDLLVRILVDSGSEVPREHHDRGPVRCVVERDASPIRGVAGVLADATSDYGPDDYIVVLNGSQVFRDPMDELARRMLRTKSDVSMIASMDGTPVGLWLLRCAPLKTVRPVGYIDLKEQALPDWRGAWDIRVIERPRASALRTRTVNEYLNAVRMDANRMLHSGSVDEDPYREEWERSFAIVEDGATVENGAIIHDSVVLRGGFVGRGAVVVRSVVCPGARVEPGRRVAGAVVGGEGTG